MIMPKLTATIVAYNDYGDIKAAVKSLELYTDKNIDKKIYIVDNGVSVSNPNEVEDFLRFLEQYDDVEYYDAGENLGFGKGHNYVLSMLESEYHAIINPDIIFKQDVFKTVLEYMDNNSDVGMCIPNITDQNGNRLAVYRKEPTIFDMFIRMFCKRIFKKRVAKHTLQDMDYSKPFQVPFGQGSFLVIRTQLFKKLNGFDDRFFLYMEDADLCKRVNQCSKLMYLPDATIIHNWKQGSHRNKTLFKYHLRSMRLYFKKWGIILF